MAIVETVTAVVAGLKQAHEVAKKLKNAELQNIIADLTCSVADLKIELADLRDQNLELRRKIDEFEQKADLRANIEIRGGLCYLPETVKGFGQGPFCLSCWVQHGVLAPVGLVMGRVADLQAGVMREVPSHFRCMKCSEKYRQ
jgi:hypothetical protein